MFYNSVQQRYKQQRKTKNIGNGTDETPQGFTLEYEKYSWTFPIGFI